MGATVRLVLSPDRGVPHWLTSSVGVAAAVLLMMLTSTTHPPGGATALIAATVARPAPWHGFRLVFSVGIGRVLIFLSFFLVFLFSRGEVEEVEGSRPGEKTFK